MNLFISVYTIFAVVTFLLLSFLFLVQDDLTDSTPEDFDPRSATDWLAVVAMAAFWPGTAVLMAWLSWWETRDPRDPFPRLTDWLIGRALGNPHWHITYGDGSEYMGRWWVWNANWKYSRKWWGKWLPAIRLHHIKMSDRDRHLHCHPWSNISIILRGGYLEVMPKDQEQYPGLDGRRAYQRRVHRRAYIPVFRKATDRHRLVLDRDHTCWSLFIMFRWQRDWGFWTEEGWVYYRDYLGLKPKEEVHEHNR